jgi:uridylate kinase
MNSIVISIGGSVILSDDLNESYFKQLKSLLKDFSKENKIYMIVGGGKAARIFIKLGRKLNCSENDLDQFGIEFTRINAKLLSHVIGITNQNIPHTTDEAIKIDKPIVIMGGTTPGHSTDLVGAELAEKTKADKFIIATNVDGVYDKDPNKYSEAKQISEISIGELIEKYGTEWKSAGKNIVIDGPALEVIKRSKISTFILNGKKLDQLKLVINNQEFSGTKITL